MSSSHDRPENQVFLENSEVDLSRVEEYLKIASFLADAELLRREFALRKPADDSIKRAKRVLFGFQGVYSAVKERDDAKTHVEWIYSLFADCLYYHLSRVASFPDLAQEPDPNDRDQVQKAAKRLLDFVVRPAPSIGMETLFPDHRSNHRYEANRDSSRESERKRDAAADRWRGISVMIG